MIYVSDRPKLLQPLSGWDSKAQEVIRTTRVVSVCECEKNVYAVTTEYGQIMVTTDRHIAICK